MAMNAKWKKAPMSLSAWMLAGLCLLLAACPLRPVVEVKPPEVPTFTASNWASLPGWQEIELASSLQALIQGCAALTRQEQWLSICAEAERLDANDEPSVRVFFEANFSPYQLRNPDGSEQGLITGYYEPKLYGSRTPDERFRYPLYGVPDDLLVVDLVDLYPQLKGVRVRGRVEGRRVVPYYDRAGINGEHAPKGRELFWVDDEIDLFFLQIQGSGRIELPDGSIIKVGYADHNGHPYASIGKRLVEMGELRLDQASMQGIKAWALANPERLPGLLHSNPSYVFFRELPDSLAAVGALGVPLTAQYSMAVDPSVIPLGLPVFLATTWPNSELELNRLMLAQDTGGAIKGTIRGDFFWGFGPEAGAYAGSMKQQGRMWVLFPKGVNPVSASGAR